MVKSLGFKRPIANSVNVNAIAWKVSVYKIACIHFISWAPVEVDLRAKTIEGKGYLHRYKVKYLIYDRLDLPLSHYPSNG